MKTIRIALVDRNIDISMPAFLFWIFKKFCKVTTNSSEGLSGESLDLIVFDEFEDITQKEKETKEGV